MLKIFDPLNYTPYKPLTYLSDRIHWMKEVYALERECASRLSKDPEFNNCYYDHGDIYAAVGVSEYLSSGHCLISKYISSCRLPNDEETYQKVKQQIEVVHRNNIVHNDIASRNIRYTKEGTIYLIDYGMAILDPKEEDYLEDYKRLDEMFSERNKSDKFQYFDI